MRQKGRVSGAIIHLTLPFRQVVQSRLDHAGAGRRHVSTVLLLLLLFSEMSSPSSRSMLRSFSDLLRPSICAASHGRDAAAFCTTRRPGSRAAGPPTAAAVRQKSACLLFMLAGLCLAAAGAVCLRSGLLSSAHYCAVGTLSLPFQAVVQRSQAELPRPPLF